MQKFNLFLLFFKMWNCQCQVWYSGFVESGWSVLPDVLWIGVLHYGLPIAWCKGTIILFSLWVVNCLMQSTINFAGAVNPLGWIFVRAHLASSKGSDGSPLLTFVGLDCSVGLPDWVECRDAFCSTTAAVGPFSRQNISSRGLKVPRRPRCFQSLQYLKRELSFCVSFLRLSTFILWKQT